MWLILRYDYLFHLLYNYKQILGKIAFNIFVKKEKKKATNHIKNYHRRELFERLSNFFS